MPDGFWGGLAIAAAVILMALGIVGIGTTGEPDE